MIKQDYRKILKYLNKLPSFNNKIDSSVKSNTIPLKQTIITQFKSNKHETDSKIIESLHQKVHSYAALIDSLGQLRYLRSLDSGEKELTQKERVDVSAARVGLGVPELYKEDTNKSNDVNLTSN